VALLVQEAEIDLRTRITLVGGLAVPEAGLLVVRCAANAPLVDFAEVRLRFLVPLVSRRLPDLERGRVIGTVVGDVFAAAHFAVSDARADRAAWRQIRHARSQLAHLTRKKAVDR
jgi:hypothetical protein